MLTVEVVMVANDRICQDIRPAWIRLCAVATPNCDFQPHQDIAYGIDRRIHWCCTLQRSLLTWFMRQNINAQQLQIPIEGLIDANPALLT